MTVALAALSAALVVALALVTALLTKDRATLRQRVADEEAARARAESALAGALGDAEQSRKDAEQSRERLDELERGFRDGIAAVESGERLRIEREWSELAGPAATLPAPWDGTLACVVANELEIIREVVGTPSTLEIGPAGVDGAADGPLLGLSAEFVREAARASDEMRVRVAGEVVVFGTAGSFPPLDGTRAAAERAGAVLTVDSVEGGFVATLSFQRPGGGRR